MKGLRRQEERKMEKRKSKIKGKTKKVSAVLI
jgi:hypothetical protein